ncbi:NADPH:quinone oxidoreductase family protein [Microbacterium sp. NPDC055910]|uniref:NADPH:quinone oxidoreductase family protein n=1 Tax=Microbacterium sp. NPDC055910 TaxID=3345659 RepID=UPI0035DAE113
MRAARVVRLTGPSGVEVADVPVPVASEGASRVAVRAVGLSYPDLLMSYGKYQARPDLPFVTGVDVAGTLLDDAPAQGLRAGDRVAAPLSHGGAAEVVLVPAERLLALPAGIGFADAAGMPLSFLTAHFALGCRADLRRGEWLLVTGAAGAVGSAAVQVAKAMGARVVAAVSSPDSAAFVRGFGADEVVVGVDAAQVREIADGAGVGVVLDVVGTEEVVLEGLRSLRTGGRLLTVGYVGGAIPAVRLNRLLLNNIDVRGVAWGPYSRANPGYAQSQWADIMRWVQEGRILPSPVLVRPLEQAAEALRDIESRRVRGRIVLAVDSGPRSE